MKYNSQFANYLENYIQIDQSLPKTYLKRKLDQFTHNVQNKFKEDKNHSRNISQLRDSYNGLVSSYRCSKEQKYKLDITLSKTVDISLSYREPHGSLLESQINKFNRNIDRTVQRHRKQFLPSISIQPQNSSFGMTDLKKQIKELGLTKHSFLQKSEQKRKLIVLRKIHDKKYIDRVQVNDKSSSQSNF